MKNEMKRLRAEFGLDTACPANFTKKEAWLDVTKYNAEGKGEKSPLLTCYCLPLLTKVGPIKAIDMSFTEFKVDGKPDQAKHCSDWVITYLLEQSLVTGTSFVIAFINIVSSVIFEKIVKFERR